MYDSSQRRKPNFFEHQADGTTVIAFARRVGDEQAKERLI